MLYMFFCYFYASCISGVLEKIKQKIKCMYGKKFSGAFLNNVWKNSSDMF